MENVKFKTEIVILPNPNQMILLKALQKEFRGIPSLPICLRCDALKSLSDKINLAEPKEIIEEEGKFFLKVEMEINGEHSEGRIELCEKSSDSCGTTSLEKTVNLSDYSLKKLSPFRIVKMEIEELENGKKWKVTEEKWCKIKS